MGLPGDGMPASRFVRTVYYRHNIRLEEGEVSGIEGIFEILNTVSIVKGAEVGPSEELNYTVYASAMCQETATYYYRGYTNSRFNAVSLKNANLDAKEIVSFPYIDKQDINYQN